MFTGGEYNFYTTDLWDNICHSCILNSLTFCNHYFSFSNGINRNKGEASWRRSFYKPNTAAQPRLTEAHRVPPSSCFRTVTSLRCFSPHIASWKVLLHEWLPQFFTWACEVRPLKKALQKRICQTKLINQRRIRLSA